MPSGFVLAKGWKSLSVTEASTPGPLSSTVVAS